MNTEMLPPPVIPAPAPKRKLSKIHKVGIAFGVLLVLGAIGSALDKSDENERLVRETTAQGGDNDGEYDADVEIASLDLTWEGPKGRAALCPTLRDLVNTGGVTQSQAIAFTVGGIDNEMPLSLAGEAHMRELLADCF